MAYRSKVAEPTTQLITTDNRSTDERNSVVFPRSPFTPLPKPPFPWVPPWHGGTLPTFPDNGERDTAGSVHLQAISDPELLKRIYYKPEYRAVIQLFGSALLERLEADPEALLAFKEFLKAQGVTLEQQERIVPAIIAVAVGVSFVGGAVLGYFAEKGKAGKQQ
jgi:hypothetical protein